MAYEGNKLTNTKHEAIRMHVMGLDNKEIAQRLNCTPQTVSNALNSAQGVMKVQAMQSEMDVDAIDVAKKIRFATARAVDVITDLMENGDRENVRLAAAKDLLDRGGYSPVRKTNVTQLNATLSPEQIEELKLRGLEAAKRNNIISPAEGDVVDLVEGDGYVTQ